MKSNTINIKSLVLIALTILAISIIILLIISLPYYLNFNEPAISTQSQDWGAYGSFISGITSILYLAVFIILTIYISRLGDANSKEQRITQKKILISQFRQKEIEKLNLHLDKPFDSVVNLSKNKAMSLHFLATRQLTDFYKQKRYLFPIIENDNFTLTINSLIEKYEQLAKIIDKIHGKKEDEIEKGTYKKFETKLMATLLLKSQLIDK